MLCKGTKFDIRSLLQHAHATMEILMIIKKFIVASLIATPMALYSLPAFSQETTKVGTLRCDVSAGIGLIITSNKEISCTFQPSRGRRETYVGNIRNFGLDLGVTTRGVLVWGVVSQIRRPTVGALAGDYVGPSAEITAGVGIGANALVGGSNKSFSLQPISISGQIGINLAAGVSQLTLLSTNRRR